MCSRRRGCGLEDLEDKLELVRARVRQLKEQIDADPAQDRRRKAAAQQRAQREMQDRLQSAVERLPELEAIKRHTASKAEEARASSTDSDASVMKMANGGYRPAYNTQYASDFDSQVIAGVQVSTSGSDLTQLAPMVEQIEQRLGSAAQNMLVDGGAPAPARADRSGGGQDRGLCDCARGTGQEGRQGQRGPAGRQESKRDDSEAVASWRATAACSACRYGACKSFGASHCCSRWRTTSCVRWHWRRNGWAWAQLRLQLGGSRRQGRLAGRLHLTQHALRAPQGVCFAQAQKARKPPQGGFLALKDQELRRSSRREPPYRPVRAAIQRSGVEARSAQLGARRHPHST